MGPERLFRDETGAALERVAELEDENARLRAEIERLRNASSTVRVVPRSPSPWVILGMAAAPAFVGIVLIAASLAQPTPPPRVESPPPPRAPRVAKIQAAKPECAVPYYVDRDGVKRYKPACLR